MKRLLLDTNIYGEIIFDQDFNNVKEKIQEKCVIHGFKIVRDELRDVPSKIKVNGVNLRIGLLHIYDEITSKSYPFTEEMKVLGEKYYELYRKFGGSKSYDVMLKDCCIVACASIHQIDIVVSEDSKSMLSENALKAYESVNGLEKIKNPSFIGYLEFKRWLGE